MIKKNKNPEQNKTASSGTEKKPIQQKNNGDAGKGKKINIKYLGGILLKKMLRSGANELGKNADEVNKLNVFPVPDGDTGDNMRMTIESGINAIENIDSDNLADVMEALSHGMLLGARGNSGVILSQFFAGIAKGLETTKKANAETLGAALELGVKQAYSSVMTPTEGTILTVARESVEYAVKRISKDSTIRSFFDDLLKEMQASLQRTPEILTVLKEAMVVDSGGAGLFYIIAGFNRVLNGEDNGEEFSFVGSEKAACKPVEYSFGPDSDMTYGYCTELLVQLQNKKTDIDNFDIDALKDFLVKNGDSVVAFKTGSIVKLHVHTFAPEKIIAHVRQFGEFLTVKIENMSVQHTELAEKNDGEGDSMQTVNTEAPAEDSPKKPYGVVAVTSGEGIESLFREFGADEIIRGGQTNNPSTNDFLEAFERINAEHIFVFPNNGNIFMASQQAADLYDKAKVHVVPSKSIGTGYVALSSANFDCSDVEEILTDMEVAMSRVTAGYVSPSIRDADMNGVHINKGDTIGIIDKEIVVSEAQRFDALKTLADKLLAIDGKSMLTVFNGADADKSEEEALTEYFAEAHPMAEIYFIDGGQDIYPYIIVAE